MNIAHAFVSSLPEGPDATQVRPSNWNANHAITGAVAQQIVFGASDGSLTQSAKLKWDETSNRLTINGSELTRSIGSFEFAAGAAPSATAAGVGLAFSSGDGGATSGNGGLIEFNAGFPNNGNGGNIQFIAADAAGLNKNGGNVSIGLGAETGGGNKGLLNIFNSNFDYCVPVTGIAVVGQMPVMTDSFGLCYIDLKQ